MSGLASRRPASTRTRSNPDPADAPHPDPLAVKSQSVLDLVASGVATVVWATGFGGDLGYLGVPVLDERGTSIDQRGVAPVTGIYFLGSGGCETRKSGIMPGVDEDARFIADRVADQLHAAGARPR